MFMWFFKIVFPEKIKKIFEDKNEKEKNSNEKS